MKHRILLVAMLVTAALSRADIIEYEFTGTITSPPDNYPQFAVGTKFSGVLTIDTATLHAYTPWGGNADGTISLSAGDFSSPAFASFVNLSDINTIPPTGAYSETYRVVPNFDTPEGTFSPDALQVSLTGLDTGTPGGWAAIDGYLVPSPNQDRVWFQWYGTIDSVTQVPDAFSTFGALAVGLAFMAALHRRRNRLAA